MGSMQGIHMNLNLEEYISKLNLGGAWACRSYTDYIYNLHFSNKLRAADLPELNRVGRHIFGLSSGYSAVIQKNRINKILDINLEINPVLSERGYIYTPITPVGLDEYLITDEFDYRYWHDKLLELSKRKSIESLKELIDPIKNDERVNCNRESLLYSWSYPLLLKLNPEIQHIEKSRKNVDVNFILESDYANETWKRWYLVDGTVAVIDDKKHLGLPPAYWLVWKFVHDASHIFHLCHFNQPTHCSDTQWMLTSESFAMHNEFKFYKYLVNEGCDVLPIQFRPYFKNILIVLVIGLLERTLRLNYDIDVHFHRLERNTFKKKYSSYGDTLFRFVDEFHGLPGFCSVYSVGRKLYESHEKKLELLDGKVKLFI